jgi:hypothetical protein
MIDLCVHGSLGIIATLGLRLQVDSSDGRRVAL